MDRNTNLEARGRWLRGASGVLLLCLALAVLLRWIAFESDGSRIAVTCLLAAFGAFQVFEAITGWCVVRALGFRTPI